MRWLVLLAVVGCTSPDPVPDACPIELLPPCPDCPPGKVRGGVAAPSIRDVELAADGNLTARICDQSTVLDRELVIVSQTPYEDPPFLSEMIFDIAGMTTDTVYVITDGTLVAYTYDGSERWSYQYTGPDRPVLVVAPEGPYLVGDNTLIALTTAGALRWTAGGADGLVPDGSGGVFTRRNHGVTPGTDTATSTVTHLDSTGAMHWSKTLTARQPIAGYSVTLRVTLMTPTATGGVAIAGHFLPTLELDTFTLSGSPEPIFVAVLDTSGAASWAHAIENTGQRPLRYLGTLSMLGDDVVVTFSDLDDSQLLRIGSAGVERTIRFGGAGDQGASTVFVGDGDEVYVTARSSNNDIEPEFHSQLTIDGQPLPVDEGYLMNYVLKTQL